jgi:hypothetical protein
VLRENSIDALDYQGKELLAEGGIVLASALKDNSSVTKVGQHVFDVFILFYFWIFSDCVSLSSFLLSVVILGKQLDASSNGLGPEGLLPEGIVVRFQHMTMTTSPQLEGRLGKVLSVDAKERYTVEVSDAQPGEEKTKKARRANLVVVSSSNPEVVRATLEVLTISVDAESLKTLQADMGAEKLSKVTHIKCTGLKADGAALLSAVIPKCTNLIHLDLNDNNIGLEGALSLCAALKGNTSITEVRADFVLFFVCAINGVSSFSDLSFPFPLSLLSLFTGVSSSMLPGTSWAQRLARLSETYSRCTRQFSPWMCRTMVWANCVQSWKNLKYPHAPSALRTCKRHV